MVLDMLQDLVDNLLVIEESDYPQASAALGTPQRVTVEDAFDQASPGSSAALEPFRVDRGLVRGFCGRDRAVALRGLAHLAPVSVAVGAVVIEALHSGGKSGMFFGILDSLTMVTPSGAYFSPVVFGRVSSIDA